MANEIEMAPVGFNSPDFRVAIPRPDNTEAASIEMAGKIAGEALSGIQELRARRAGREALEVADTIYALDQAGLEFDPESGELTEESLVKLNSGAAENDTLRQLADKEAEVFKKSQATFTRLGKRFAQAGIEATNSEAKILIEKEIRDIIGLTPGFKDVVRQAAAETLGFDPLGYTADNILSRTSPRSSGSKTELEKFEERVDAYWSKSQEFRPSLGRAQARRELSKIENTETEANFIANQLATGKVTVTQAANKLVSGQDSWAAFLSTHLQRMSDGGTPYDLSDTEASLATIGMLKNNELESVRQLYISQNQTTNFDAQEWSRQIDAKWSPLEEMLSNTEMSKVYQSRIKELEQLATLQEWTLNPQLMSSIASHGEQLTGKYIDLLAKAQDQGQLEVLYTQFPHLKEVFGERGDEAKYMDAFSRLALAAMTGAPFPTVSDNPAVQRDSEAYILSRARNELGNNGQAQFGVYQGLYSNGNRMSAFNYIASDPNVYFSMSKADQEKVAQDWALTMYNGVIKPMAAGLAEAGMSGVDLENRTPQIREGVSIVPEGQQWLTAGSQELGYGPGVLTGLEWINKSVRNNPRAGDLLAGMTNGAITSVDQFDNMFRSMIDVEILTQQHASTFVELQDLRDTGGRKTERVQEGNRRFNREVPLSEEEFKAKEKELFDRMQDLSQRRDMLVREHRETFKLMGVR